MSIQQKLEGIEPEDIKVWGYQILVKVKEADEMTKGGIILSSQTTDKENLTSEEGVVLSVGEFAFIAGVGDDSFVLGGSPSVGDRILFNSFAGTLVTLKEGLFRVMKDNEVVAVIRSKDKEGEHADSK